jgi:hypothetical protein
LRGFISPQALIVALVNTGSSCSIVRDRIVVSRSFLLREEVRSPTRQFAEIQTEFRLTSDQRKLSFDCEIPTLREVPYGEGQSMRTFYFIAVITLACLSAAMLSSFAFSLVAIPRMTGFFLVYLNATAFGLIVTGLLHNSYSRH